MKRDEKEARKYRKAVFVVVYRKTKNFLGKEKIKYLILKRKKHWNGWEFPKGGVDRKETQIKSAKREVFEETGQEGFNTKEHNLSGKYKYPRRLKDRKSFIGQTFRLFSAEVKKKKCKIDQREHSDYRWLLFQKAKRLVNFQNQKESLELVNKFLENKK
jgi:8-oxo-dGTP pyrophosphatase MutT (NUDIX family)